MNIPVFPRRVRQDIPDVLLIVAGDGPAWNHVKRLSQQLGLQPGKWLRKLLDFCKAVLGEGTGEDLVYSHP